MSNKLYLFDTKDLFNAIVAFTPEGSVHIIHAPEGILAFLNGKETLNTEHWLFEDHFWTNKEPGIYQIRVTVLSSDSKHYRFEVLESNQVLFPDHRFQWIKRFGELQAT